MKAHEHLDNPVGGDPIDPTPPRAKPVHLLLTTTTLLDDTPPSSDEDDKPRLKIKIRLADSKIPSACCIARTRYWSPESKPIFVAAFMGCLSRALSGLFTDEDQRRKV